MAKRVKKGFERSFASEDGKRLVLREHKGLLSVECWGIDGQGHWFDLPACDVEALGMTAALEDVPEPWERVREAIREATKRHQGRDWTLSAIECQYIAEALGIEPGEDK